MAKRKIIDEEKLLQLAAINSSLEEISDEIGVSVDTLGRRYAEVIKSGRSKGKVSLKKKAWQMAMAGDKVMLIFLLKNMCGYSDKVEYLGDNVPNKENYTRPESMTKK